MKNNVQKNIRISWDKIKTYLISTTLFFILNLGFIDNSYALTINNVNQSGDFNCAFFSCESSQENKNVEKESNPINTFLTDDKLDNIASEESENNGFNTISIVSILISLVGIFLVTFSLKQRKKLLTENSNLRMRVEDLEVIITKDNL